MKRQIDPSSTVVIIITFGLFAVALVTKGFTHELLLEAGVFLVSVKLMILSYKAGVAVQSLQEKMDRLYEAVQRHRIDGPP